MGKVIKIVGGIVVSLEAAGIRRYIRMSTM
jgi:hypothetical protein